jgi:hypothetical protein
VPALIGQAGNGSPYIINKLQDSNEVSQEVLQPHASFHFRAGFNVIRIYYFKKILFK